MDFKKCSICSKECDPTPSRVCESAVHVICKPCFTAYEKKRIWRCPCIIGNTMTICNQVLIGTDFGTPVFLHFLLENLRFPCESSIYGCKFTGNGYEILEHQMSKCEIQDHRTCPCLVDSKGNKQTCEKVCQSSFELISHLIGEHTMKGGPSRSLMVDLGFEIQDSVTGENWIPVRRTLIHYDENLYSMLIIDENSTHFRLWLTEIDPAACSENASQYVMYIPAPVPGVPLPRTRYEFQCKVLPYMTWKFSEDEEEDLEKYVEIDKKFLRRVAVDKEDKVKVQVLIQFPELNTINNGEIPANEDVFSAVIAPSVPEKTTPPDSNSYDSSPEGTETASELNVNEEINEMEQEQEQEAHTMELKDGENHCLPEDNVEVLETSIIEESPTSGPKCSELVKESGKLNVEAKPFEPNKKEHATPTDLSLSSPLQLSVEEASAIAPASASYTPRVIVKKGIPATQTTRKWDDPALAVPAITGRAKSKMCRINYPLPSTTGLGGSAKSCKINGKANHNLCKHSPQPKWNTSLPKRAYVFDQANYGTDDLAACRDEFFRKQV